MLIKFFEGAHRWRLAAFVLPLLGGVLLLDTRASAAEAQLLHLRCINAKGGANWSLAIDLDHGLVDSRPAKITDTWISWHNPNGGTFELERSTGNLQLRAASSTGGYFLHYNCQPE
jgi:hypothetical protein